VYSVADSPLCLTGTAEVPLAGLHMDAILPGEALPLRLAAFGRAFRTEAGAAGSASRGLYRLHQFSKVGAASVLRGFVLRASVAGSTTQHLRRHRQHGS
jgi:seryl-tRNA synthetase